MLDFFALQGIIRKSSYLVPCRFRKVKTEMKQKNFFRSLISALAVVFLCSCGSPEETVENFYEALYDGDFEAAKKYCSDEAAAALDPLIALADESPEAMELWRKDMAFEKKYFRLLTPEEIEYQQREDEKQKKAAEKQKKEIRQNLSEEEFKAFEQAEQAELDALKGTEIVYTRWSKGLVYKHYVKKIWGRWKIVKIENAYPLPDRITKGN